jgi:predicted alpha/beta hydrolase family esterase
MVRRSVPFDSAQPDAESRLDVNTRASQVLFIHGAGAGAFTSDAALVKSLREALGDRYTLHYPQMPDEDRPAYATWRGQIARELATMEGVIFLVGHSLGGSVLLKFLAETGQALAPSLRQVAIAGLFLVAAPYWGAADWELEEYALTEGFASRLRRELPVFLYHCRDDAIVPFGHVALYAQHLPHATLRAIDQGGHQLNNDLTAVARDISALATGH